MVIGQPDAAARAQILVHGKPHFEAEFDLARMDGDKCGIAPGDARLTGSDAEADAQGCELGGIASPIQNDAG